MVTKRSDCGNGSGRSRIESITAKIARFAPRQIAIVASAVTVNAGALPSWRRAKRRSVITTTSCGRTLPQYYSVRNAWTGSTSVARRGDVAGELCKFLAVQALHGFLDFLF